MSMCSYSSQTHNSFVVHCSANMQTLLAPSIVHLHISSFFLQKATCQDQHRSNMRYRSSKRVSMIMLPSVACVREGFRNVRIAGNTTCALRNLKQSCIDECASACLSGLIPNLKKVLLTSPFRSLTLFSLGLLFSVRLPHAHTTGLWLVVGGIVRHTEKYMRQCVLTK
jgi:hypothetical protein